MISITVTAWGSGQYKIARSDEGPTKYAKKADPGQAAAEAVGLSRGLSSYCILAPSDVLDLIPERVRQK